MVATTSWNSSPSASTCKLTMIILSSSQQRIDTQAFRIEFASAVAWTPAVCVCVCVFTLLKWVRTNLVTCYILLNIRLNSLMQYQMLLSNRSNRTLSIVSLPVRPTWLYIKTKLSPKSAAQIMRYSDSIYSFKTSLRERPMVKSHRLLWPYTC